LNLYFTKTAFIQTDKILSRANGRNIIWLYFTK